MPRTHSDVPREIGRPPLNIGLYPFFLLVLVTITSLLAVRYVRLCSKESRLDKAIRHEAFRASEEKKKEYKHLGAQVERFAGYLGALSIFHLTLAVVIAATDKTGLIESSIIPSPSVVFTHLDQNLRTLMESSGWSLLRLGLSLSLGGGLAVLLGVPLGQNAWLRRRLAPHIMWVSGLPPIVLAGVFVAILGPKMLATVFLGLREPGALQLLFRRDLLEAWYFKLYFEETIQIVLTTWAIFWPVFTAAVDASVQCPKTLLEAADICGATPRQKIRLVVRPQALPHILTNLRVGVVIGFIVLLWVEAARPSKRIGLGKWVYEYYEQNDAAGVFACILLTVALVFIVLCACEVLQRYKVRWLTEYLERGEGASITPSAKPDFDPRKLCAWVEAKKEKGTSAAAGLSNGEAILVENISKSYGAIKALDMAGQALQIVRKKGGNIISIIGQSSHGKTTLVKLIAGLLQPDPGSGQIGVFGQQRWRNSKGLRRSPQTRIAYVFQDFALFPHMTVKENILFPLRLSGAVSSSSEREMGDLLDLLDMRAQENKYPPQLSGGQKQRVAIARALMQDAELLILDEPLASLDQPTRGDIRQLIREYARALSLVVLNVSHDRQDVLEMSDQVIYIKEGRIWDFGPPYQLFFRPRQKEVARFLGHENLFLAQLDYPEAQLKAIPGGEGYQYLPESAQLRVPLRQVRDYEEPLARGGEHHICIPASWINFQGQNGGGCQISARIRDFQSIGSSVNIKLVLENGLHLSATVQDDEFEKKFPGGFANRIPNEEVIFCILGATPIFLEPHSPGRIEL
jgi:ABC-type Fe3+/spermidine/putrescine transport system ATPase subunit/ABC-type nitrate/sulfonate/bicarbonate transport system permease component